MLLKLSYIFFYILTVYINGEDWSKNLTLCWMCSNHMTMV